MEEKRKNKIPDNIILAIQSFFKCNGFVEEFNYFLENYNDLKNCSFFIYSNEEGIELPELFKTNCDNDFAIIEIGFSDKYYAIDALICEDMIRTGEAKYALDICVELDTQVVSYLKNIFKGLSDVEIPTNKRQLFSYLTNAGVNYSSLPYLVENATKIDADSFADCYQNLMSYEMFKCFDFATYMETGNICFFRDMSNIQINTDNSFSDIKSNLFYEHMKDFYDMQKNIYCLLMKAVKIEITNSKKSANNKMKMFIEFVNYKLGIFCEREMAICYYYFTHNEKTQKFFKKTKANSKKLKDTLKGMAWDLTHIRMLECLYDLRVSEAVKFGIHPILTYDNGLKDVLMLYPIKKIAIYEGHTIPCFKQKFFELFPESIELIFEKEVAEIRRKTFERRDMQLLINELEEEIDGINKDNE